MDKSIYSHDYQAFLQRLRDARRRAGLTQEQLAAKLGQTQSFVSKCERGDRRIDVIELMSICRALDLPFDTFVKTLKKDSKSRRKTEHGRNNG